MLRKQIFTALIVFGVMNILSPSSHAMLSPKKTPNSKARDMMIVLGVTVAGIATDQLRQMAALLQGELNRRAREEAEVARVLTPQGLVRPGKRQREDEATFLTPRTKQEGDDVLYVRCGENLRLGRIDLQGHIVTQEDFMRRLMQVEGHDGLMALVNYDLPRYVGITDGTSDDRCLRHINDAKHHPERRHYEWANDFLVVQQNLVINIHPAQIKQIEVWVIAYLKSNSGRGLNSNSGSSTARGLVFDNECADENFSPNKKWRDDGDDEDHGHPKPGQVEV